MYVYIYIRGPINEYSEGERANGKMRKNANGRKNMAPEEREDSTRRV